MDVIQHLRGEIRRSLHGPAWHGPALGEVLAGVTAAEAAARPIPGAHSAWEVALHCAGWMEEVARRLGGAAPELPARGDWPAVGPADESAWTAARAELDAALEALDAALAALDPERLTAEVGGAGTPVPALGSGVTYAAMLHGVAQHNAYHAGQVMLLARAARHGAG